MQTLDVVFDGQCGVCTRAAAVLARIDRRDRVRLHPAQRPGVLERFGLSAEDAAAAAWAFVDGSPDRRYRGAAAVNRALDAALGGRVLSVLYRLPGMRQLQNRAYRWVAEHRYRLRGVTPWCTQHPEDCADAPPRASCAA